MSEVEVVTPELGLMLTEVTTGLVLPTMTDADPESVPPSVSVAVAVHVMVSPGCAMAGSRSTVVPVPSVSPLSSLVQT
jgi:hypothetical protein